MKEQIVLHQDFGRGRVINRRYMGFHVLVRFDSGQERWLRYTDVQVIESVADLTATSSAPRLVTDGRLSALDDGRQGRPRDHAGAETAPVPALSSSPVPRLAKVGTSEHSDIQPVRDFSSRQIIEALRLGIVPEGNVEGFTFGREAEVKELIEWLEDSESHSYFLAGNYGSGKTHLLNYLSARAKAEHFAVAYVSLDPNETALNRPKRLYAKVARSVRAYSSNDKVDFRSIVRNAIDSKALNTHPYFGRLAGRFDDEYLWKWIECVEPAFNPRFNADDAYGDGNLYYALPALPDYQKAANVYCNLLTAVSWATQFTENLRGLLVLFDEAESLGSATTYGNLMALNFFSALIDCSNDKATLLKSPASTGYTYAQAVRSVPFLHKSPCHLKLLFAFTQLDPSADDGRVSIPRMDLKCLAPAAYVQMRLEIVRAYEKAYGWKLMKPLGTAQVQRGDGHARPTRLFVKEVVEELDLIRMGQKDGQF